MSSPCSLWAILSFTVVGMLGIVLGGLSIPFFKQLVNDRVSALMPLQSPENNATEPKLSYRFWADIPQPMFMKFRFFHVDNPLEIITLGEKPYLTEKGPYVYSERRHKTDIVFGENGSMVSFREISVYHFEPEMSLGGEDDIIRLLNVPFLTVLNQAKNMTPIKRMGLELLVTTTKTQLFEKKTVRDWLWGYEDLLLKDIKQVGIHVPFTFFGWFMHRNGSDTGSLKIKTGHGDLTQEASIEAWKGQSQLNVWGDQFCNAINGTDGTMFHPFVNKNDTLYMFSPDICRSIYGRFESELVVKGLKAFKFVIPSEVFANTTVNPDNACYCVPDVDHCLGAGVLNISACQFGAPVVSSQPHLFEADPSYISRINGLDPKASLHQTYLHIEPVTGMVLNAAKRLQINGFVENIPVWSTYFKKFPDKIVFPVIWIEESAVLDDSTASTMRGEVTDQINLTFALTIICFAIGGVCLVSAILLMVHRLKHQSYLNKLPKLVRVNSDMPEPCQQTVRDTSTALNGATAALAGAASALGASGIVIGGGKDNDQDTLIVNDQLANRGNVYESI